MYGFNLHLKPSKSQLRGHLSLRRRDTPYWEFVGYVPDPV